MHHKSIPSKENKLFKLVEKWLTPVVAVILIGAATWVFITRVDKLEILTTSLSTTVTRLDTLVGELDKSYSKDAETKGILLTDLNSLKVEVGILKEKVRQLEN
jgi:hypothetical protein